MKFKLRNHQIIHFYDRPIVILSESMNPMDTLSLQVEDDLWLVCKFSPDNLADLRLKNLTELMKDPNNIFGTFEEHWVNESDEYSAKIIKYSEIKEEWFPGDNFKL